MSTPITPPPLLIFPSSASSALSSRPTTSTPSLSPKAGKARRQARRQDRWCHSSSVSNLSSWIDSILYYAGFLAILTKDGNALLYSNVPSYFPGLLSMGSGKRSPGYVYAKFIKGKYPYQRIEGSQVQELRSLLSKGRIT